MKVEKRLKELGIELAKPTTPMGSSPQRSIARRMEKSISLPVMGISTTGVRILRSFRLAAVPPRETITSAL